MVSMAESKPKCTGCLQREFKSFLSESLSSPIYEYEIEPSAPSSWISGLKSINTWSNRQVEWLKAENRFLFACERETDCDKWVTLINWMARRAAQ